MNTKHLTLAFAILAILTGCKKKTDCPKEETTTTTSSGTTMTFQPGVTTGNDAVICSYTSTTNFGINYPEISGLAGTVSGNPSYLRGLFMFDLSNIPVSTTIKSAKLSLYGSTDPLNGSTSMSGTNNACIIVRITSAWEESVVTWNTQPSVTTTNQVSLPHNSVSSADDLDIDVTALVQDMVNNPTSSFGFELKMVIEAAYYGKQYASSDYSDATKHPKLVVSY